MSEPTRSADAANPVMAIPEPQYPIPDVAPAPSAMPIAGQAEPGPNDWGWVDPTPTGEEVVAMDGYPARRGGMDMTPTDGGATPS